MNPWYCEWQTAGEGWRLCFAGLMEFLHLLLGPSKGFSLMAPFAWGHQSFSIVYLSD